jgi:hypothetical protein
MENNKTKNETGNLKMITDNNFILVAKKFDNLQNAKMNLTTQIDPSKWSTHTGIVGLQNELQDMVNTAKKEGYAGVLLDAMRMMQTERYAKNGELPADIDKRLKKWLKK